MLVNLKETGISLGRELGRTWDNLSEGWRELFGTGSSSLTSLVRSNGSEAGESDDSASSERWRLLEGKIEEADNEVVVRVEIPGMDMECCIISIESKLLYVSGVKRAELANNDRSQRLTRHANGSYQRVIPLPNNIDSGRAEIRCKNGVLTVRLPKVSNDKTRVNSIPEG